MDLNKSIFLSADDHQNTGKSPPGWREIGSDMKNLTERLDDLTAWLKGNKDQGQLSERLTEISKANNY